MRAVDLGIDYRDRHVGAARDAVGIGQPEFLADVLGGVALLGGGVAARGRILRESVEMIGLHQWERREGAADRLDRLPHRHAAVVDVEFVDEDSEQPEILLIEQTESAAQQVVDRALRKGATREHQDLVLHETGLAGRRHPVDARERWWPGRPGGTAAGREDRELRLRRPPIERVPVHHLGRQDRDQHRIGQILDGLDLRRDDPAVDAWRRRGRGRGPRPDRPGARRRRQQREHHSRRHNDISQVVDHRAPRQ
jgi:hypothetical protein